MHGAFAGTVLAVVAMIASLTPSCLNAEVIEWTLVDQPLRARTTAALLRFYRIVRPDSLRVRYITANAPITNYRLRAERAGNDTSGQLVSISLGQLTLASTPALSV
ncbi:MAG: hypothetical protein H7X80_03690, partial [bacterium]|nr:hypothetical protein [Candidatus Kapabacteria bacterium]